MVLAVILTAVASILAVSVLYASAMRAQISANALQAAQAEYLAESGMNIALHYLQFPRHYTGAMPDGYYPGETNLSLGPGRSVSTLVQYDAPRKKFLVRATGRINGNGQTLEREVRAEVRTIPTGDRFYLPVMHALVANGNITITDKMTVTATPPAAAVATKGRLEVVSGGRVLGSAITDELVRLGTGEISGEILSHFRANAALKSLLSLGSSLEGNQTLLSPSYAALFQPQTSPVPLPTDVSELVPAPGHIADLRQYRFRTLSGSISTHTAQKLSSSSYSNMTLNPSVANPAGIFWTDTNLSLNNVTVNGTLIVRGGANVTFKANGVTTIRPRNGFPALVVEGSIILENGADVTLDGFTYAQKITAHPSASGSLKVCGALALYDKNHPLASDKFIGTINVQYDASKAQLGGFGIVIPDTDVRALKVLSWTGP
ncbi:MAG: pilus assembly PilX N-terminal domain-containing protein [Phycisphaerae bacterium]|nr:pilus assembly PilX N-terminal domain-containing protein [Phycisphaerae bacterium]MDW8260918.1 pilus assembly PilX N-terminal domain-containing protein [Phycisphaerales bacterium]